MPADIGSFLIQLLSGLSRAMMLFLLSSGLSLIFGVMNILNFAHATLWLLAGYITFSIYSTLAGHFGVSILLLGPSVLGATAILFGLGWAIERFLVRRMYGRELPEQLLLTFALILIIGDLIKLIWGVQNRRIVLPIEPMPVFDSFINPYLFVIIVIGAVVAALLWWFLARTRTGKIVRAAVYSREMVSALGIRIPTIYAMVYALGVAVAAFSAGIFLPIIPIGLGLDMDLIVQCFAVVVIGGFGSIAGTLVASLVVGILYSFSILIWPDGALAIIFVILVAVLIWRPWGLFGTEMRS
jgi:branched-subunit amino acid ABC-type transport system permease component